MRAKLLGMLAVATLASPMAAQALSFDMTFTATGFQSGAPAPTITGQIRYEAAGPSLPISALTSIVLNINGHAYTLSEVNFVNGSIGNADRTSIGGTINGLSIAASTDDFRLDYLRSSSTAESFIYSTLSSPAVYSGTTFSSFSIARTSVPEPGTLALLGLGLVGLGLGRRRKAT